MMKIKHLLLLLLMFVGVSAKAQDWTWVGERPVSGGKYYLRANLGDGVDRFLNNTTNSFDASPTVLWTIGGTFRSEYTLSSAGGNFAIRKPFNSTTVETNSNKTDDDAKLSSSENNGLWEIHRAKTFTLGGNRNIAVSTSGLSTASSATNCWEFISEAQVKAYQEYVAIQTNIDMTFAIKNPSFETGNLDGWSIPAPSSDTGVKENSNATYTTEGCDGNYLFNTWWQGVPLTQTIENVPNGKYTLTVSLASSDPNADGKLYLLAQGNHSEVITIAQGTSGKFNDYSFDFEVTDGTATIGVVGGNADGTYNENGHWWYKADNFRLTLVAPRVKADMAVNSTAKYGTFCAPFNVEIPAGVKAYTVDDVEGNALVLDEVTTIIPANKPVILNAEEGLAATTFYGLAVNGTPTAGLLTGVYTQIDAPAGSYILYNVYNVVGFYRVADSYDKNWPKVSANRCYLTAPAQQAKMFSIGDGGATAIETVTALTEGKIKNIYNVNAAVRGGLQQGVNIVTLSNGKTVKVIVK